MSDHSSTSAALRDPDEKLLVAADQPAAELRAILHARARDLARLPLEDLAAEESLEVVEFLLAGEHYAVETIAVREVYPLRDITPLPCTPPFVLGIVNVRGQVLAVMDLRRFFDLPLSGITDLNKVIILQSPQIAAGILADSIAGVRSVPLKTLQPPLPTMTGVRAQYLHGVSGDGLIVLDAAKLLNDERIVVHEEVEAQS
jgi:purine-binding chemotaxis protein CheW